MRAAVVIMAGGTGGHVFPALAVAELLRGRGLQVSWLGTRRGIEARLVPAAGYPVDWISIGGLRGKGWLGWVAMPFRLAVAVVQALGALRRRRPAVVLGLGGFASGPGGLAARLLALPLVIHEQNARAGLTNRALARLATQVLAAFPGAFPARRQVTITGNPVRAEILGLPPPRQRLAGREGPLRLLVLGGSLGAAALNRLLPQALQSLAEPVAVLHQAGRQAGDEVQAAYLDAGVEARVVPFIDDMAAAYGWADLVICRAGALTVAELAAAGVGALLVPFPYAVDDHQTANGRFLADVGAARLLPQAALDAGKLAAQIRPFIDGRDVLLAMAEAARRCARPLAAEQVAATCMRLVATPAGGAR